MNKRYVAISLTLGSLALAGGAQADTWNVTQKVAVGANTTVTQGDGNTSATQAMIAIDERDLRELAVGSGGFDRGCIARAQSANEAVMVHCAASPAAATSSKAAS